MFVPVLSDAGVGPVLNLDFTTGTLDSRISFSRLSTAKFYNSAGILTSAGLNAPRFDYDPVALTPLGLLIEESRTNLALQSNAFGTTWALTTATIAGTSGTSPDGSNNAWKLAEPDSTVEIHKISQGIIKAASALPYALTVFAKAAERTRIVLQAVSSVNNYFGVFDLAGGQVGPTNNIGFTATSAAIQSVGNGWYRCTIMYTTEAGTNTNPTIYLDNGTGTGALSNSYAGTTGFGVLIYGAQLEQAAFPTSYIATTTAAVTRSADVATVATSSFAFNGAAGSWALQAIVGGISGANPRLIGDSGSPIAPIFLPVSTAPFTAGIGTSTGSVSTANTSALGVSAKIASAYASSNQSSAVSMNAGTVAVGSFVSSESGVSIFQIGGGNSGSNNVGQAWFQRVRYYNSRLADATIQALTI